MGLCAALLLYSAVDKFGASCIGNEEGFEVKMLVDQGCWRRGGQRPPAPATAFWQVGRGKLATLRLFWTVEAALAVEEQTESTRSTRSPA